MTDQKPATQRFVAFITPEKDRGPVLIADDSLKAVFEAFDDYNVFLQIREHGMSPANREGLLVWEGHVEQLSEEPEDILWEGTWRPMTHWELYRLRFGLTPFPAEGAPGA